MSRWFRFYDTVLDDPKVQRLAPDLFKSWVNVLCIASKHDGILPPVDDLAFLLRLDEKAVAKLMARLTAAGLLDEQSGRYEPHGWTRRQHKSDVSNERVRRFRERQRNGECNVTGTASGTAPEAEAETETDPESSAQHLNPGVRGGAGLSELETTLRAAAGLVGDESPGLANTAPISALLAEDFDLEMGVLPVLRAKAAAGKRGKSWSYYVAAIRESRSSGQPPPGKLTSVETSGVFVASDSDEGRAWEAHWRAHGGRQNWLQTRGAVGRYLPTSWPPGLVAAIAEDAA